MLQIPLNLYFSILLHTCDCFVVIYLFVLMFLDLCGTSVENNPCEEEGGCKTMCLLAPGGGRTCTCPENFELGSDGVSCQSNCLSSMFVCNSTYKCIPFWWKCDTQVRIIMYYLY